MLSFLSDSDDSDDSNEIRLKRDGRTEWNRGTEWNAGMDKTPFYI